MDLLGFFIYMPDAKKCVCTLDHIQKIINDYIIIIKRYQSIVGIFIHSLFKKPLTRIFKLTILTNCDNYHRAGGDSALIVVYM